MFLLCGDDFERVDERMGLLTARNGKPSIVDWVHTCYNASTGASGGDTGQEGHILYTLSALQVLAMANCLDRSAHTVFKVVQFIALTGSNPMDPLLVTMLLLRLMRLRLRGP
jgi:hypothetical protein